MTGFELILAGHLLLTPVSAGPGMPSSVEAQSTAKCPVQSAPQVEAHWRSEPVKYDLTQNYAALGAHSIDTKNPYGMHVTTDVGGLMSGKINYKSGIEITGIRYAANRTTCLWINKVSIDIVIDPTIFIASENPKGTCKFVAIVEHESKHVAIDRRTVQDHLPLIRQAAVNAVAKVGVVGPKPDEDGEKYKEKMSDYVEKAMKAAVDEMYADRAKRQAALDSKEEYERVDAKCAGKK